MEKQSFAVADGSPDAFFSLVRHTLKFRLYLLKNLPAAFFSGLKIVTANSEECTVAVPFKWFTRNPFRSTYFACLSMAAELSTGVLAMAAIYNRRPSVSMLVTGVDAKFYKKAKETILFSCAEGKAIERTVAEAIQTGQGQQINVYTKGRNKAGELVAEFWFTWSFKAKENHPQG